MRGRGRGGDGYKFNHAAVLDIMRNRRFKREETKARKDVFFCSSQRFNDILGRWGKINLTLNWRSEPNSRWGQRQREEREKRLTSSGAKERAALGVCEALSRFVCRNIGNYSRYSDHASPASPPARKCTIASNTPHSTKIRETELPPLHIHSAGL